MPNILVSRGSGIPVLTPGYVAFAGPTGAITGAAGLTYNDTTKTLTIAGSANALTLAGSATGLPVTLTASGSDTNVTFKLAGKGAGGIQLGPDFTGVAVQNGYGAVEVADYNATARGFQAGLYVDLDPGAGAAAGESLAGIEASIGTIGTINGMASVIGVDSVVLNNNGAITVDELYSFRAIRYASGPVTTTAGVLINQPGGGAAIGTNYGLLIGDHTRGSTNYAIYTGAGNVRIGALSASELVLTDASKNLVSGGALASVAVTSITGTANQVIASAAVGPVTLSLPQSIATTSAPQFAGLGLGAAGPASGIQFASSLLFQEAANALAIQNGTTAQTLRLYNTISGGNNEHLVMRWSGNTAQFYTEKAGTGTLRGMSFGTSTTSAIVLNNAGRVQLASGTASAVTGMVYTQNTYTTTSGNMADLYLGPTFSSASTVTTVAMGLWINPTINYSNATPGLGSYRAIYTGVIETALPTGTSYLLRLDAGSAGTIERFSISNRGAMTLTPGGAEVDAFTITGGTVTVSHPLLTLRQTWNAAGVTFTGALTNITATAKAAGSLVEDWQVGGASVMNLGFAGNLTLASTLTATALILTAAPTAAPSTTLGITIVNRYGGDTNILGDPTAWLLVTIAGNARKIPLYA